MLIKSLLSLLTVSVAFLQSPVARADSAAASLDTHYKTDFAAVTAIGADLHRALSPKLKPRVAPLTVVLESDTVPYVRFQGGKNGIGTPGAVRVSSGFVNLVNHLAHARAIDNVEHGYFQKYVATLPQPTGDTTPAGLDNPKYWTDDVINEQTSTFNQMVGVILGTHLAYQYLGHYQKYAAKLTPDLALSQLVSTGEFEAAIKAGANNALDCGYGVAGIKIALECFDLMPQRPAWSAFFLSDKAKSPKLRKDLERLERVYFAGDF